MAQDYGAAQPIVDLARKGYSAVTKAFGNDTSTINRGKKDTAWHDKMVREANESFKKSATRTKVSGTSKQPATRKARPGGKRTTKKLVTKR